MIRYARIADILGGLESALGMECLARPAYELEQMPTVIDTRFRVDEAATAVCVAEGLLVSQIWQMRTGRMQTVRVNTAHAALTTWGFMLQTQHGHPIAYPDAHRTWPIYPLMNAYRSHDGRHVYLAGVYAHLRDGLLDLLGTPNNAPAIGQAVSRWNAEDLEREINARGLCATIVRSAEEWKAHPQGKWLSAVPVVRITRLRSGAPMPFAGKEQRPQPLSGIRVVDATHVLAGPMATRALAAQGADVLRISNPNGFELLPFAVDTGHGKRNAFVDLKAPQGSRQLRRLIRDADIFVDGYQPGSLARLGFGAEEVSRMRDGIICCTLSCYGADGPLGGWGGFEQLGQAASGLMAGHSGVNAPEPKLVPAALCDYLTGGLAALGMLAALVRRATEGGSYHVEVSLARTGMWVHDLGDRHDADIPGVGVAALNDSYRMESETCFGTIKHLKPAVQYPATPPQFRHPAAPLGSAPAAWTPSGDFGDERWP